ncbi:MBL fold metallo-hydrolase [Propionibacteriaceae bacterium G1746]|uniref:MBL fold metallo-hydrolase n=1 Tax=Aestuariimicrobium sp. G57 TaxID=3418485 RepID=UPI003C25D1CF
MQITHLGHACVLLEAGDQRVLFDPGNFSTDWHGLTGLSAVVATHQHPDHFDREHAPVLFAANPDARVLLEPELCAAAGTGEPLHAGDVVALGDLELVAVGGRHAIIHADIPGVGNVGVVVRGQGQPTFFHPGDSLAETPQGIDVVAVPAYGPWAAMKETIDFVRAVDAPHGFLIHDGLLGERGWALAFGRLGEMSHTSFDDLRDGRPRTY